VKRTRTLILIALGLSIAWTALPARAQLPAPQPTFASTGTCPAQVRFDYDVSSVPNATHTQWQLRRGEPGSNVSNSDVIESTIENVTSGSVARDLRQAGPVLDGTRWFFRVRARQGSTVLTDYSPPAIFEPDLSPDGMFSVSQPPGTQELKLDWSLSGDLGACADRIAWEVKKDAPFANPQAPDPSVVRSGTVSGTSGSETIDLAALGTGTYYARLVARHGGDTVDDAVGRWGAALQQTLGPTQPETVTLVLRAVDKVFSACRGSRVDLAGAGVRIQGAGVDQQVTSNATGTASFVVPPGSYTATVTHPTCGAATTRTVDTNGGEQVVEIEGCFSSAADVVVTLPPTPSPPTVPFVLTYTLLNAGTGPTQSSTFTAFATDVSDARADLINQSLAPFCPGEQRTLTGTHSNVAPPRNWSYRGILALADANRANNTVDREVSFPATPRPGDPVGLRVTVQDLARSTCTGSSQPLPGASVRVVGPGIDQTRASDAAGLVAPDFVVRFGDSYTITAQTSRCASGPQTVTAAGSNNVTVQVPNCTGATADVFAIIEPTPQNPTAGNPFPLTVVLDMLGTGPSSAGELILSRFQGTGAATEIQRQAVAAFCAAGRRTIAMTDPALPLGSWTYRAQLALAFTDANAANNVSLRSVTANALSQEADEVQVLTITSFDINNGAASVQVGTTVTLNFTTTGQNVVSYRAAECGPAFENAGFTALVAGTVPTLPGFTTTGITEFVCLQVRGTSLTSAMVAADIAVAAALPALTSFQLRRGQDFAVVNVPITLNAEATGGPDQYRVASRSIGCRRFLNRVSWNPWSGSSPPTLPSTTEGVKTVCFQLRRSSDGQETGKMEDTITVLPRFRGPSAGSYGDLNNLLGDTSGSDGCDDNWWPIGISVHGGHHIDVLCGTFGPTGASIAREGPLLPGEPSRVCPSGEVMVGLRAHKVPLGFDWLEIACRPSAGDAGTRGDHHFVVPPLGGGPGTVQPALICPEPYAPLTISSQGLRVGTAFLLLEVQSCWLPPAMFQP
jgi:hypothetical protein